MLSTPDSVYDPIIDGLKDTSEESLSKPSELEQKTATPLKDSSEPASGTLDGLDEGGLADAVSALEEEVGTTAVVTETEEEGLKEN